MNSPILLSSHDIAETIRQTGPDTYMDILIKRLEQAFASYNKSTYSILNQSYVYTFNWEEEMFLIPSESVGRLARDFPRVLLEDGGDDEAGDNAHAVDQRMGEERKSVEVRSVEKYCFFFGISRWPTLIHTG